MNKEELNKAMNRNLRVVFITVICCSTFWIITGIALYKYIAKEQTTFSDREAQMMSGFYKRDVKIKIDSITNAMIIQTLRNQLVEKQVKIDSLEKAYVTEIKEKAERSNELHRNEYESDELMMFMHLRENLREDDEQTDSRIELLNNKNCMGRYRKQRATLVLALRIAKYLNRYDTYKVLFVNGEGRRNRKKINGERSSTPLL